MKDLATEATALSGDMIEMAAKMQGEDSSAMKAEIITNQNALTHFLIKYVSALFAWLLFLVIIFMAARTLLWSLMADIKPKIRLYFRFLVNFILSFVILVVLMLLSALIFTKTFLPFAYAIYFVLYLLYLYSLYSTILVNKQFIVLLPAVITMFKKFWSYIVALIMLIFIGTLIVIILGLISMISSSIIFSSVVLVMTIILAEINIIYARVLFLSITK